jgi:hypothetical protein
MELPKELFELKRLGVLTNEEFIKKFSEWQANNGYNDVKGYANKYGVFLEYKGYHAEIKDGFLLSMFGKETGKAIPSIRSFKRRVNNWLDELREQRRKVVNQMDVDRTCDRGDTVEYLYPDTAAFNCLTAKQQKQMLNH